MEGRMIRTPVCDALKIAHPIALGGMGSATSPELVSAVSNAGGLGALGCHYLSPEQIRERTAAIRAQTVKPFGLNFLLFDVLDDSFATALELRPPVMQFAWARPEQDLRVWFDRAHKAGCIVTHMAGTVPEALRAAKAGADIIIAQGTEGGGHVGWMASMPLIPMVVDAVAPVPVLAAGGFADGRGLVAALSLGADGILLGTRFLATVESPLHPNFKQAIVESDGHDTQLSEIPDIAAAQVWPGALTRSRRNRFIERWAGREWALRADRGKALERLNAARKSGDPEEGPLSMGQDAGLIHDIPPAAEIVRRIAQGSGGNPCSKAAAPDLRELDNDSIESGLSSTQRLAASVSRSPSPTPLCNG
jgi:NAD(P)H-dependent flavin oxidoreductase YrpB (nitropropane dioxygenase family)